MSKSLFWALQLNIIYVDKFWAQTFTIIYYFCVSFGLLSNLFIWFIVIIININNNQCMWLTFALSLRLILNNSSCILNVNFAHNLVTVSRLTLSLSLSCFLSYSQSHSLSLFKMIKRLITEVRHLLMWSVTKCLINLSAHIFEYFSLCGNNSRNCNFNDH